MAMLCMAISSCDTSEPYGPDPYGVIQAESDSLNRQLAIGDSCLRYEDARQVMLVRLIYSAYDVDSMIVRYRRKYHKKPTIYIK